MRGDGNQRIAAAGGRWVDGRKNGSFSGRQGSWGQRETAEASVFWQKSGVKKEQKNAKKAFSAQKSPVSNRLLPTLSPESKKNLDRLPIFLLGGSHSIFHNVRSILKNRL